MSNDEYGEFVEFADGSLETPDYQTFFEIIDLFASTYGLGANKSLSEFAEMINNEDPVLLKNMVDAAIDRINLMWGGKKSVRKTVKTYSNKSKPTFDDRTKIAEMLINFGVPREQVNEAIIKSKTGQIKVPIRDYGWITPEELEKPGFNLKKVLADMREDQNNSINFKVSGKMLEGK